MLEHGIGQEEIAWIQRDQFAYYLEVERRIADPADWEDFRLRLVVALTAAWGLDTRYPARLLRHELLSIPQRRALHLLDHIHQDHDPSTDLDPPSEKPSGPAVTSSATTSHDESHGLVAAGRRPIGPSG